MKFANDLENIENGNYNDGTSMTNQRFNSVFTGLKRELRYFIRIDGELVDEIDAIASQPYFLNRILTSEFFNGKKQGSLCFIFPELYKEFISSKKKIKVDTHNLNYVWDVNTTNTTKFKSNINEILNKGVSPVFYMSGKIENICDIREFGSILYLFDFYEFILQDVKFMMEQTNVQRKEILKGRLSKIDRKHAKTGMMFFINDKYHRNHNNFVKAMKTAYPNVNLIVEFLQNIDFGSAELNKKFENPFSLLIQRIEAYHFLRIGVKGFCDRFENEPLITIHDSVIVKKSVSDEMRKCLHTFIEKETGIPMGLSTKAKNPFITIKELVNEYLQECKVAKKS